VEQGRIVRAWRESWANREVGKWRTVFALKLMVARVTDQARVLRRDLGYRS